MFKLLLSSFLLIASHTVDRTAVGSIRGVVLDRDGRTLPGAKVYGLPEQNMLRQIGTTADDTGRFTMSDVPAGTVYVSAFKESDGYPYNFFSFFRMPGEKLCS